MQKNGIDAESMPYWQAKQLLVEIFRRRDRGLSSFKQAAVLKRQGFVAPMRRAELGKRGPRRWRDGP